MYLQEQCLVLFQLLRSEIVPQSILAEVLPELVKKAKAPFQLPFTGFSGLRIVDIEMLQ